MTHSLEILSKLGNSANSLRREGGLGFLSLTTVCQADLLAAGTSQQLVLCREPQAAGPHSWKDSPLPELPLGLHFRVQRLLHLPGCVLRTVWDMGYGNPVRGVFLSSGRHKTKI